MRFVFFFQTLNLHPNKRNYKSKNKNTLLQEINYFFKEMRKKPISNVATTYKSARKGQVECEHKTRK
jgi:hypothetical protein